MIQLKMRQLNIDITEFLNNRMRFDKLVYSEKLEVTEWLNSEKEFEKLSAKNIFIGETEISLQFYNISNDLHHTWQFFFRSLR